MKRRTRRWGRILFNTLTAISLLLAIAMAGLWVRSFSKADLVYWRYADADAHPAQIGFASYRGRLAVSRVTLLGWNHAEPQDSGLRYWFGETTPARLLEGSGVPTASGKLDGFLKFDTQSHADGEWTFQVIAFKSMHPAALFSLLPLVWILHHLMILMRQRRHGPSGHCPACGYDARANLARCSECGQEMPATTTAEGA